MTAPDWKWSGGFGREVAPLLRVVECGGARVWREGAHQPAAAVGKKVKFLRRAGAHGTAHCRRTDQDTAAANLCHRPQLLDDQNQR